MILPSGSLNQADLPIPAVVTTWLTVLNAPVSYSSKTTPHQLGNILVDVRRPEADLSVIGAVALAAPVDEDGSAVAAVEEKMVLDGLGRELQADLVFVKVLTAR